MIDYDKLMALAIPDVPQTYDERDVITYALSVGLAHDPLSEAALRYCYEKELKALPTLPLVLGYPGFWIRDLPTGIDSSKVVHGEQEIILHEKLPVAAQVVGKTRVTDIVDKGEGRGALVFIERKLFEQSSRRCLATMTQTSFCRGDGGFGGPKRPSQPLAPLPPGPPHIVVDLPTHADCAFLYRLLADRNPLHVDPAVARAAGFPRPILHGLATFAVVGHALLKGVCSYEETRLERLATRLTKPVYPGETIRTEIWIEGQSVQFRALVPERNVVVMEGGRASLRT